MPRKRVYTDKEISAVLKRAAELQRTQGVDDTSGLSLAELEQIAAEVGIDPGFVKQAALELEEGEPEKTFHLLGGPTSIDLERIVEGPVSEEKWEEVVREIRRMFNAAGETGQVGRMREWIHRDQTGERMHVTVSPVGGQTRIRIFYRMTDWAVATHSVTTVAVAPIVLQYALLNLGPLLETGIALFILVAFHMLARFTYGALARRQERKARKLLARLDDLISEPETASPEPAARLTAPEGSRLDTSLLSGEGLTEPAEPAHRREQAGRRRTR